MDKPKAAFICVHNSCRSQMAEAISKLLASETFEAYSAGTEVKEKINPDAVDTIKELYGVDMEKTQRPKLLAEIPPVDFVITMGCNVECPYLPCRYREDWGLEDPTGRGRNEFINTAKIIEKKVLELKQRIKTTMNKEANMDIRVYGAGCASCKKLYGLVLDALKEMNIDTKVAYITDMNEIVQAGIMRTPALFINGKAKILGRVPSIKELKQMISDER